MLGSSIPLGWIIRCSAPGMDPISLLTFSDLKGLVVRKMLPVPIRIGDSINLEATIRRVRNRRTEEAVLNGEYRVTQVSWDARGPYLHQCVTVEATKVAPVWKSVRSAPKRTRLAPTRTSVVLS